MLDNLTKKNRGRYWLKLQNGNGQKVLGNLQNLYKNILSKGVIKFVKKSRHRSIKKKCSLKMSKKKKLKQRN